MNNTAKIDTLLDAMGDIQEVCQEVEMSRENFQEAEALMTRLVELVQSELPPGVTGDHERLNGWLHDAV